MYKNPTLLKDFFISTIEFLLVMMKKSSFTNKKFYYIYKKKDSKLVKKILWYS